MLRSEIENAMSELLLLLDSDSSEDAFQSWFERHPVVFTLYDYKRCIAHPRIKYHDNEYIPDFLAERINGIWEIVELKTASTPVVRKKDRRKTFYSRFEEYISQCREYSLALQQDEPRRTLNGEYNIELQSAVQALIVAGRRKDVDHRAVHALLCDRGARVALATYDDVLDKLEFYRKRIFAKNEGRPGMAVFLLFVPEGPNDYEAYILDIGANSSRDRMSLYISREGQFTVCALDSKGIRHHFKTPLKNAGISFGDLVFAYIEVVSDADQTHITIELNGHCVDFHYGLIALELDDRPPIVTGSDYSGQRLSNMLLCSMLIARKTLTFQEKLNLRLYYERELGMHLAVFVRPSGLRYKGNQFMYSTGHPNFS